MAKSPLGLFAGRVLKAKKKRQRWSINDKERYRKEVLEYFQVYQKVFNFIRNKMKGEFSVMRQLPSLLSIFRYMKKNESRFGMEVHMRDLMKVAKA